MEITSSKKKKFTSVLDVRSSIPEPPDAKHTPVFRSSGFILRTLR